MKEIIYQSNQSSGLLKIEGDSELEVFCFAPFDSKSFDGDSATSIVPRKDFETGLRHLINGEPYTYKAKCGGLRICKNDKGYSFEVVEGSKSLAINDCSFDPGTVLEKVTKS
jgi:hypothetical protein